ncbi:MAG: sensor histidine kinase [Woeseia sp.]
MLPKTLIKGFDKERLKGLLALFFVALAAPTAALIWQAYGQLKWEAFHQHRSVAEELTTRMDAGLIDMVNRAEARSFADYSFLVVTGDPDANFVQRSPLSEYPVTQDLPGVIGYFQVGTAGEFSTPLLPQGDTDPSTFGIGTEEYEQRLRIVQEIQNILSDNRLVRHQPAVVRRSLAAAPESPEAEEQAGRVGERLRQSTTVPSAIGSEAAADKDELDSLAGPPEERPRGRSDTYNQAVFDELNQPRKSVDDQAGVGGFADGEISGGTIESKDRRNTLGKVADLKLDSAYEKKSEVLEQQRQDEVTVGDQRLYSRIRAKRREQIALPEAEPVAASVPARQPIANLPGPSALRISTFESEIDPLEFSLLDSGHFVLFRKVWREGERYIQGLLIDRNEFVRRAFSSRFRETALAAMSNLIVAYQDDVIDTLRGGRYSEYPNGSQAFDGALLYRNRLSAPFSGLELIYSVNGLPPGPGATVLGWVTLVLAIVFAGGFFALYRLGLSQINLARQQQDFVSAVSHELKTPLTSIRMYGEMLKEGWADPEKRQQYYEFIHDESERLTRLISNVLQLAKITRNEPQFDIRSVTVGELMNQVDSKISNQVQRAGFKLVLGRDELSEKATISIDEDCFAQIIINLIDNAIKFSKDVPEKRIEILSRLTGDNKLLFAVRDFGPGIPRDQMKKIFQLFYRSESELTRETVGTGIGLAIVHQLAVAMEGTVDVVNREPGAEFRVTFPATAA